MEQEAMSQDGRREVFRRVWDRVMPEGREACPFELEEEAVQVLSPEETAAPAENMSLPALVTRAPGAEPELCLAEGSAHYGAQIQRYIDQELADWRAYQALARRVSGGAGRALNAMAADEHRHAKRLSTAYFLISGVRYWPARSGEHSRGMPIHAALRERFLAEQRGSASYRQAAGQTGDHCLAELFQELAGEEESHAWLIRSILEQM